MRQRTRPSLLRVVIHRLFGAEPLPEPNHNYYNLDHMKEILIFSNRNTKVSFAEMRLKMSATWHPLFLPECELKTHKMRAALSERILMLSINGVTVCHRYLLFIYFFQTECTVRWRCLQSSAPWWRHPSPEEHGMHRKMKSPSISVSCPVLCASMP